MRKKIYYWSFEGNEGTGKTSLSKRFADACGATWTYEPNAETEELRKLRELALTENSHMTKNGRECILLANRSIHHQMHVVPLLQSKETVVTDRSFLSGMVYARLNGVEFKSFMEMSYLHNLVTLPDAIIYCTSEKRIIVKNPNDIYDNADEETLLKIDSFFEEALEFVSQYIHTKHIKILRFQNDLSIPAEKNAERLVEFIKDKCR